MPLQHNYASHLKDLCSPIKPFPVSFPELVAFNHVLAHDLNFNLDALGQAPESALGQAPEDVGQAPNNFSNLTTHKLHGTHIGQALLQSLFTEGGTLQNNSVAQKYGGHQFGHWNPHLGDGRGLLLGELHNRKGQLLDLHLKGAGPTPYSRHADGRAVLRSTIREYLGSEAMHHLHIPSSRSLALISSKEPVVRETMEHGAMMIRTCPSHIRFGHFEYFYHANESEKLDTLFNFCFEHHFTHLKNANNKYLAMLTEICVSTATLIAHWQAYGFNHGVMNTDNMSIHGITFDYGPYAFLDDFIPNYICNKSDHDGRYAFNQQPSIGLWNLNALAHAFSLHLNLDELKIALAHYEPTFLQTYQQLINKRLGFGELDRHNNKQAHLSKLSGQFLQILSNEFADYHQSFRYLSHAVEHIHQGDFSFANQFSQKDEMLTWCAQYKAALSIFDMPISEVKTNMLKSNPKYVLRNHLMQTAISKAQNDDFSAVHDLLLVIANPFAEHPEYEHLSKPPSEQEKGLALSCSS